MLCPAEIIGACEGNSADSAALSELALLMAVGHGMPLQTAGRRKAADAIPSTMTLDALFLAWRLSI
jgi:hypothetical protein